MGGALTLPGELKEMSEVVIVLSLQSLLQELPHSWTDLWTSSQLSSHSCLVKLFNKLTFHRLDHLESRLQLSPVPDQGGEDRKEPLIVGVLLH